MIFFDPVLPDRPNELPRRKQRGINLNIFIAPRGGELTPRPLQAD